MRVVKNLVDGNGEWAVTLVQSIEQCGVLNDKQTEEQMERSLGWAYLYAKIIEEKQLPPTGA